MSREEDAAIDREQQLTEKRIVAIRRSAKIDTSNESGLCWYCDNPTGNERRFCDKDCADGWSKEFE